MKTDLISRIAFGFCILTTLALTGCGPVDPNGTKACFAVFQCIRGTSPDGSGDCDGYEQGNVSAECNACLAQAPCEPVAGSNTNTGKQLVGCDAECPWLTGTR